MIKGSVRRRGIACKCPRCGSGKLYAGFLNLRPNCEACGLDYAFIDTGDGPASFDRAESDVPPWRNAEVAS